MARALPFRTALALTLLAGCSGASRQVPSGDRPDASAPGVLRFAWPEGYRARVDLHHERNRPNRPPTRAVVRQHLAAERRGDEIWVSTSDSKAEGDEPNLEVNLEIGEALVYVVSREGAFLRAEGVEKAIDLLPEDDGRDRERARASLQHLAQEDWAVTVGVWRGRRLEEGKPQRLRIEGGVPLMPGIATALDVELTSEGRVPCVEGREASCVRLRYVSLPAAKQDLLDRLRTAVPEGWAVEDGAARFEATLVTDPDTLVPRRLILRQELRLRVRPPGAEAREIEERSLDDYRFTQEEEI